MTCHVTSQKALTDSDTPLRGVRCQALTTFMFGVALIFLWLATMDCLTNLPVWDNVCSITLYKANRMKCGNTPHGSNPTLVLSVRGLRSIVYHRWTFVLRASSGSADSAVGMSRFVFRVVRGMYA